MNEHLDIAKLQAVFTFVNLLYIVYPSFIINIMYLCLYGHEFPYSESHSSNNGGNSNSNHSGKVINNYENNTISQFVINGNLLLCLILLSIIPIAIFSYCSVIRARFGFYYVSFFTKCKDYILKFGLISTILLPALLLEIIHFWPLFLEYYYYQSSMNTNHKHDTDNKFKFDSITFLVLLLIFNLPKGLFVPEICKFSKADFTGMMRIVEYI